MIFCGIDEQIALKQKLKAVQDNVVSGNWLFNVIFVAICNSVACICTGVEKMSDNKFC